MAHTIFILGTDPQQCKELRDILQDRTAGSIVTAYSEDALPPITESDNVIIASDEKEIGVLYRRVLQKLERQVQRAELLGDLIHLFSSSLRIDELLERVVSKSTDILGDSSFVVLLSDAPDARIEAAFSKHRDNLVKMLIGAVNLRPHILNAELLADVLERRNSVVIPNLTEASMGPELRSFVQQHSLASLLAVPNKTKEVVLGAFI
jgi:hypothetical protein